jgi:hypothetical protein
MSLSSNLRKSSAPTQLQKIVGELTALQRTKGHSGLISKEVGAAALSMESVSDTEQQGVDYAMNELVTTLEHIAQGTGVGLTLMQKQAAQAAAIYASDVEGFVRMPLERGVVVSDNMRYVGVGQGERLKPALEAYDEKENRAMSQYSVAYNMQSARQDEFGETLYPTVVVTRDQVGFIVSIQLVTVYEEVRRQISGALDDFNRRNIVHAVRDPSILDNFQTKIVPVYRTESQSNFVAEAVLPTTDVNLGPDTITTSALAFNKAFSLLGISQTDSLVAAGLMDSTDAVDTDVKLENIYLQVGGATGSVIKLPVGDIPYSNFNYSVQGSQRLMTLNFVVDKLPIPPTITKVDGTAPSELADQATAKDWVQLSITVTGSVDLQTAKTSLMAADPVVSGVVTEDGVAHPPSSSAQAGIVALYSGAKLIGYDLEARRTNSNRRQRGQLLDITNYNQAYNVPLLSPITVPRPLGQGDQTDSSDLNALIVATRIRTSNSAVDELLRVANVLKTYIDQASVSISDTTEILGVSRYLITPFYEYNEIVIPDTTDSLSSSQRNEDISATIVNFIRDVTYRMYRDSNYKAASEALAGGATAMPTVVIATEQYLERYIMVTGEMRTLGTVFNVKVVSTPNIRMEGKIFVTFLAPNAEEGVPSPLSFGNMAWSPELALVLPIHRNGANNKELTVQPSYRHITNLPILAEFKVTGIKEVISKKVPLNVNNTVVTP